MCKVRFKYKALPPKLVELLHAIPAHFSNSRDMLLFML
jgi:hypothetical protein